MKKFKFILPALAFVFAMVLSFASVKSVDSYAPFFIQYADDCVSEDLPCSDSGQFTCQVLSDSEGTLDVYRQVNPNDPTMCQIEVKNSTATPVAEVD